MTLRARVSELDDFSGELTQALEKLGIEHARGAINRDEQLDFLGDLRRTMASKELLPLKHRAWVALFMSLLVGSGAAFVPSTLPHPMGVRLGIAALALLGLAYAGWTFTRYFRARGLGEAWLGRIEAVAAKGGTIFDVS